MRVYEKLLLILSEHSIGGPWIASKVERTLEREPAGVPNVLFPIRLDKAVLTCEAEWAKNIVKLSSRTC